MSKQAEPQFTYDGEFVSPVEVAGPDTLRLFERLKAAGRRVSMMEMTGPGSWRVWHFKPMRTATHEPARVS
jgi:hypothetical protein